MKGTAGRSVSNNSYNNNEGHDRSIRVWGRTDQQLFIEEERENELEAMFENDIESKQRGYTA